MPTCHRRDSWGEPGEGNMRLLGARFPVKCRPEYMGRPALPRIGASDLSRVCLGKLDKLLCGCQVLDPRVLL